MTESEAQRIVTLLTASHPNMWVRLSGDQQRDTMAAYRSMLRDLEYDVANAAVSRLLATLRYMPTPAEIRESALAVTVGEQRIGGQQWGAVLKAIGRYGIYRRPGVDFHFDDEVTAQAVAALSWTELCNSENQVADRARFIELYDQLASRYRRKQLSEGLAPVKALEAKRQVAIEERTGVASVGALLGKVLRLTPGGES